MILTRLAILSLAVVSCLSSVIKICTIQPSLYVPFNQYPITLEKTNDFASAPVPQTYNNFLSMLKVGDKIELITAEPLKPIQQSKEVEKKTVQVTFTATPKQTIEEKIQKPTVNDSTQKTGEKQIRQQNGTTDEKTIKIVDQKVLESTHIINENVLKQTNKSAQVKQPETPQVIPSSVQTKPEQQKLDSIKQKPAEESPPVINRSDQVQLDALAPQTKIITQQLRQQQTSKPIPAQNNNQISSEKSGAPTPAVQTQQPYIPADNSLVIGELQPKDIEPAAQVKPNPSIAPAYSQIQPQAYPEPEPQPKPQPGPQSSPQPEPQPSPEADLLPQNSTYNLSPMFQKLKYMSYKEIFNQMVIPKITITYPQFLFKYKQKIISKRNTTSQPTPNQTIIQYKNQNYVVQLSPEAYAHKQQVFLTNLEDINYHNATPDKTYIRGVNQFADLTDQQFSSIYARLRVPNNTSQSTSPYPILVSTRYTKL